MDCSPPGPSVHAISQARILQWVAIFFSKRSSQPRDQTHVSCFARRFVKDEPPGSPQWSTIQSQKLLTNQTLPFLTTWIDLEATMLSEMSQSVQSLSCVWLLATPWTTACQTSLFITNSRSLLKLMSIKLVMPSNHLILYCPLLLLPSIFPSIRVFSNESVLCIRWPTETAEFQFSISPSNEYSGPVSWRIDWFDLPAVQGTLKEYSPTPQFKSKNESDKKHEMSQI